MYDLYGDIKRSFVNFAMGGCVFEITSIKDSDLRRASEELFLKDYVYRFEIAEKPKEYFFIKHRYNEYMDIVRNQ